MKHFLWSIPCIRLPKCSSDTFQGIVLPIIRRLRVRHQIQMIPKHPLQHLFLEDRVPFSLLHCPIREVIWMFFHPDNCNFYCIEEDTVKIRQDAEMPNIIVFRKFMADFAQPMTAILRIRTFCKRVLSAEGSPPQMYFIYAEALRDLLRPMEEYRSGCGKENYAGNNE
uniref:Uncharacterized protein n=1 Tax=Lutzomyia longipalpis TaxID=7200 RepID=A0A1B0CR42_LUTLO